MKFLNSGRSLESVMSRNNKMWAEFQKVWQSFQKSEYFEYRKSVVQLVDVAEIIPQFVNSQIGKGNEQE